MLPESLHTLEAVLRAGYQVDDVIAQDEYSHDVLVAEGAGWLVFDTT